MDRLTMKPIGRGPSVKPWRVALWQIGTGDCWWANLQSGGRFEWQNPYYTPDTVDVVYDTRMMLPVDFDGDWDF